MHPLKSMERIAKLLPDDESVICGFNQFLPFDYSMVLEKDGVIRRHGRERRWIVMYLPDVTVKRIKLK